MTLCKSDANGELKHGDLKQKFTQIKQGNEMLRGNKA